jgi:GR25 family glycosyltransferase involved in LPS biosynthesis
MDVFYINLESQTARRRALEENFRAVSAPGWSLTRVEAVTAGQMAGRVPGRIGDGEKGCFHSHIKALTLAGQSAGPVLIAEDDMKFGSRSCATIENAVAKVPPDNWDVIFTDISITNIHAMMDLLLMRRQAAPRGEGASRSRNPMEGAPFGLVNLARMPFAGSVGYVVNPRARDKLLALISSPGPLEFPYDIFLQRAIAEGRLRGFVTFPFATTLSAQAEASQIGKPKPDEAAMNAFRRLMWLERDIDEAARTIAAVTDGPADAETETFLKILSVFLAPGFRQ